MPHPDGRMTVGEKIVDFERKRDFHLSRAALAEKAGNLAGAQSRLNSAIRYEEIILDLVNNPR